MNSVLLIVMQQCNGFKEQDHHLVRYDGLMQSKNPFDKQAQKRRNTTFSLATLTTLALTTMLASAIKQQ